MRRRASPAALLTFLGACGVSSPTPPPVDMAAPPPPMARAVWSWWPATPEWDVPIAVAPFPDESVAVLGWAWEPSDSDRTDDAPRMPLAASIVVQKLRPDGTLAWTRRIGGGTSDLAFGLVVDDDGGIVVAGQTRGMAAGDLPRLETRALDGFVLWLDAEGEPRRIIGFGGTGDERIFGLARATDGTLHIVGATTSSDFVPDHTVQGAMSSFVGAIDRTGTMLWARAIDGDGIDIATSTTDTGWIAGVSQSTSIGMGAVSANGHGRFDVWVGHVDAQGELALVRTLGGTDDDYAYNVVTSGADALVAGVRQPPASATHGQWESFVTRVRLDGTEDGLGSACCVGYDYAVALRPRGSGVAIASLFDSPTLEVGGRTLVGSGDGHAIAYLTELDELGHARWANTFGAALDRRRDFGVSMTALAHGDLVVAMPSWREDGYDVRVERWAAR